MSYTPQWLKLVLQFDSENLKGIPNYLLLKDNGISQVWSGAEEDIDYIYKRSIPFLIENEIFFLSLLSHTGYVPKAERFDKYTIRMPDLGTSDAITDPDLLKYHFEQFLDHLNKATIIHGDLTPPNIIIKDNHPWFLDWGEARLEKELRPPKRVGKYPVSVQSTDQYWLYTTLGKLTPRKPEKIEESNDG